VGSQMRFENRGQQALAALRDWNGVEASSLPRHVSDCLYQTADDLSTDTKLWFGSVTEQLSKAKNTSVDGIVQSWPEIARIASARRTSGEMQGAMTLDGAEA